ncbi:DUF2690 domain-containing protein [Actinoplanes solisilvae]|uniref:DUF2690 domain-containing protein n=1 Tax=Actinoplanes solisilvae TaxID=2486853 RepID=UPI0013E382BA|nr:DUF2690 domain-containing protein [Actinoplanes solisilvae]
MGVFAVASVATTLMVGVPTAAQAATCYASTCDNKDPEATGCGADAETKQSLANPDGGYRLELRYSPTCRAAWARGVAYQSFKVQSFSGGTLRKTAYYDAPTTGSPTGFRYTRMVNDAGLVARACIGGPSQPESTWACTASY